MDIYSSDSTLDSLIEECKKFDDGVVFGNRSHIQKAAAVSKIKHVLIAKTGSEHSREYQKALSDTIVSLRLTKVNFRKLAQIGAFVMSKNDDSWYDKPLSEIQKEFRKSETKTSTRTKKEPVQVQTSSAEVEELKALNSDLEAKLLQLEKHLADQKAELEKKLADQKAESYAAIAELKKNSDDRLSAMQKKLEETQEFSERTRDEYSSMMDNYMKLRDVIRKHDSNLDDCGMSLESWLAENGLDKKIAKLVWTKH